MAPFWVWSLDLPFILNSPTLANNLYDPGTCRYKPSHAQEKPLFNACFTNYGNEGLGYLIVAVIRAHEARTFRPNQPKTCQEDNKFFILTECHALWLPSTETVICKPSDSMGDFRIRGRFVDAVSSFCVGHAGIRVARVGIGAHFHSGDSGSR
ncbi:hypothetical protein CC78DRAFT_587821 [Lojkania enalia]|uniref:Uncharacterized protein n=1 Tax=Lojkania enalia TaxID=147567 RepID=A0A9P4JZJ4_9PLEO|nr:hypothetical protein CC78DRAFT_587821 [Didymosphaeria enalia]